jgi:hypothetical protein
MFFDGAGSEGEVNIRCVMMEPHEVLTMKENSYMKNCSSLENMKEEDD